MSDDPYLVLNRVIDGEATPEEQARVEAWLSEDDQARQVYDELAFTVAQLESVDSAVPPPPRLKQRIMEAIPADRYARSRRWSPQALLAWLESTFLPRPSLAYATMLAVGMLVGVVVMSIVSNPNDPPGESDVVGTMGGARILQTHPISLPALDGELRVAAAGDVVSLELDLATDQPTEVQLSFDTSTTHWQNTEALSSDSRSDFAVTEGQIRLAFERPISYGIEFVRTGQAPIEITFVRNGQSLYQHSF